MPLYAYECEACGYEFERQQPFSEDPIRVCPTCGAPSARRLITPVGIIFKGSGFYITDNRKALRDGKASSPKTPSTSSSKSKKTEKAESVAA